MNTKKISLIIITLLVSQLLIGIVSAESMNSVRGKVYVDDTLTLPDQIRLDIQGETYYAGFNETYQEYGFRNVDANVGSTGTFLVTIPSGSYLAEETLVINEDDSLYLIDLHVNTSTDPTNNPPDKPTNPNPLDGTDDVSLNPTLQVSVSDPDNDTMDVTFYDANGDTIIGTDTGVSSEGTASVPWSGLSYSTSYSWYAIAHDDSLEGPSSDTWSFTTEAESTPPGPSPSPSPSPSPITGGDDVDTAGPGDNEKPTAMATVNMNTGSPGTEFNFDASDSSDPEGTALNYTWDFKDGSIGYGETITHTFSETGTYNVMLTVEDEGGLTDTLDEALTIVIAVGNNPPTGLTITPATTQTSVNTTVTFTISATDPDENDTIEYTVNWDDTNLMTSDPLASGASFEAMHAWESYGVYTVTVTAEDEQNATDETTATVWVDVYVIDDEINGWLIDTDSDGTFDMFRNSETNQETDVEEQEENVYLIDVDDDDSWDYTFNTETDTLTAYGDQPAEGGINLAIYALVGLIIILLLVFGYFTYKNKQEQQRKQQQQQKKKSQEKKKKQSSKKSQSKKSQSKKSKK